MSKMISVLFNSLFERKEDVSYKEKRNVVFVVLVTIVLTIFTVYLTNIN